MSNSDTERKQLVKSNTVRWTTTVTGSLRAINWRRIDVEVWLETRSRSGGSA